MPSSHARTTYLAFECFLLFFATPLAITLGWLQPTYILPLLGLITLICFAILLFDPEYDRKSDFRLPSRPELLSLLPKTAAVFLTVLLLAGLGDLFNIWQPWFGDRAPPGDQLFLRLLLERPTIFAAILLGYPLLSAFPQEILYRSFFFQRYAPILGCGWLLIFTNAAAFGIMHLVFLNWLAPILTLAGGLLITLTYFHTRSTLLATIEHTLYGYAIWLSGLGWFFFFGWNRALEAS
ncbi:MAG: CPBP family intramembrane glutamic endopeptidase [Verrucomicrobiota bacterium]